MATRAEKPCILIWYSESENPHIGLPFYCVDIIKEQFQVLSLKDVFDCREKCELVEVILDYDHVLSFVLDHRDWFPNVKIAIVFSSGYDHLDITQVQQSGIRLTNLYGFNEATTEFGVLLLLLMARDLNNKILAVKQCTAFEASMANPPPGLSGSTVGIVGMGRIGTIIARTVKTLSANVIYHNRRARDWAEDVEIGAVYVSQLHNLLCKSDYVILTCPLTNETRNLIGRNEFKVMKKTAALINIARGEIIDQEALIDVLKRGELRAAAVDVTIPPTLSHDHPLLCMPNVIVTNHIAYCTQMSLQNTVREAVMLALDGLQGKRMKNELLYSS